MRKIYFLLLAFLCHSLVKAQSIPSIDFTFSVVPNTTYVGFTNASKSLGEGVKKAFWIFGDGSFAATGALDGAKHQYAAPGIYQACLRIYRYGPNPSDSALIGSECKSVNIPAPAIEDSCKAAFTVQTITASPLGRKFIAQAWHNKQKKVQRVCWTFGDGKDTCVTYPSSYTGDYLVEHTYSRDGQYEACVVIHYDGGCESKKCELVNIPPVTPPAVCEVNVFEVAGNVASLERKFYVGLQQNKMAEKICWKFGDGTDTCVTLSTPLDPKQLVVEHRYAAPGNYSVCIRVVYAGGCVAERCRSVEIRMPQNNICGGYFTDSVVTANSIRFKAASIHSPNDAVAGYLWTFGDGTAANELQVTHSYASPGKYTVLLVIKTVLGCETRITKQVQIAGEVKPQLVLTPNPVVTTLMASFQSLFQQTVSIKIFNGNGILLKTFSRNAVVGSNTWTFDASDLKTGVYSMIVQSPNQLATAIFFKQ